MAASDLYGLSRVVGQRGVLPQRAATLDPALPLLPSELLIDVESLNIDAASFKQIKEECGSDPLRVGAKIQQIVSQRGKMQNPVTGSGGMLIGRVAEIGPEHPAKTVLAVGDRIATLVSLTLTPLQIRKINAVHLPIDRVDISGHAILFASGLYAKLPTDMPETLALAALDVCGAPALVQRHIRPGMTVALLGSGKSGALCLAQAKKSLAGKGKLIALDLSESVLKNLQAAGLCDATIAVDATRAVEVMEKVAAATDGKLVDLIVNCASVPGTEMGTILSVRDGGTAIFFSMATSFTAAALGAEGVGKDVTLIIGNGYAPGHADLTLNLLREDLKVRALFERFV
ncbi:MAG: L-erythro-3,5-diaminohexanoate dehydrogenase [Myxococcaceae bacterium]